MSLPDGHPLITGQKTGVLLVNLGTPDGYDVKSMRRYLGEFLSDPRVIEAPAWLWKPILHGIILNTRPKKSGAAYEKIWIRETNESPLRFFTRKQADSVTERFKESGVVVAWAMRYGSPSIADGMAALEEAGCLSLIHI